MSRFSPNSPNFKPALLDPETEQRVYNNVARARNNTYSVDSVIRQIMRGNYNAENNYPAAESIKKQINRGNYNASSRRRVRRKNARKTRKN